MNEKNVWRPSRKQELFLSLPWSFLEAFFGGSVGCGKAIDINEIIPTPNGYRMMKDIHKGDFVYNHEGDDVIVLEETEIFENHDCFRLNFDSGVSIVCDKEHKWIVHENNFNDTTKMSRYNILTSEELFNSDKKYSIIVSKPLQNHGSDVYTIDPYTLGVWLGDGGQHDPKITCADNEIINRIASKYEVTNYGYNYSYRILKFTHLLEEFNLLQNKHIPESYFRLNFDSRLALLQGLMDTDGTITPQGTGIELSLSDEKLAKDALKLIRSLGIKAHCSINKSMFKGKNYKERYRIGFATKLPVFSLRRKAERHEIVKNKSNLNTTRNKWHYIKSIEKVESVPVKCIQVHGGVYLVSEACIPTHNSDVLLLYPAIRGLLKEPDFKGLYLRRTFPELKNEIIPRSRGYFRQFGGSYNKNDKVWEFSSISGLNHSKSPQGAGALFFFGHCENEDDIHNYDSMQPNYVAFDELTSFTEWIYLYITLERVRRRKLATHLPMIVRSAGMPGGIGHIWCFNRFVKPHIKGLKVLIGPSGIKRIFIPSTIYDNEHIDPAYLKSLEALPEAEKQAKLYGRWDSFEGQVFEEFRERHYPDEPDNAIHCIDSFDIPNWWPRIVCGDWGFAPPAGTWIGYGAISPNKQLIIYREQYWQKVPIEIWASQAKPFIDDENPRVINFCKSAGQDRGQEHTIQQQISDALGRPVGLSNNSPGSRVATKMLLHEYFRWKQRVLPPEHEMKFDQDLADWIFRNKTDFEYRRYIELFNAPVAEQNLPKVKIFKKECPLLIQAIKSCVYDKSNPQDVAEFSGDDPYDGFRYLVDAADKYFEESANEFKSVQERQELIESLNSGHIDMTAFYMNARRLEQSTNMVTPVTRYHH